MVKTRKYFNLFFFNSGEYLSSKKHQSLYRYVPRFCKGWNHSHQFLSISVKCPDLLMIGFSKKRTMSSSASPKKTIISLIGLESPQELVKGQVRAGNFSENSLSGSRLLSYKYIFKETAPKKYNLTLNLRFQKLIS